MYNIKLPNFEGPFDLLLYFIKRDEINIYDIPIARITEEFLSYIRLMQTFDLELAGEFLVMAATLMFIKAQMLIPKIDDGDETAMVEDPRREVVERLLEYKQFKTASWDLAEAFESQRYIYYRKMFDADKLIAENGNFYKNATLFDLMKAFKKALDRASYVEPTHHVEIISVSVEEKSALIITYLKKSIRTSFFNLIQGNTKPHIIATFLAILELMKQQKIFIKQEQDFDDIEIALRPPSTANAAILEFDEVQVN